MSEKSLLSANKTEVNIKELSLIVFLLSNRPTMCAVLPGCSATSAAVAEECGGAAERV